MIFGKLRDSLQLSLLLKGEPWKIAFDWISELNAGSILEHDQRLDGKLKLSVDSYSPRPAEDCRFESHREFVDIQFLLSGGEMINVVNNEHLEPDGDYDSSKDVQFFKHPVGLPVSSLRMKSQHYAFFFPEDAHCPQIEDGEHTFSQKAVLKVHKSLLIQ